MAGADLTPGASKANKFKVLTTKTLYFLEIYKMKTDLKMLFEKLEFFQFFLFHTF
jgi:hypothetical protein